MTAETIPCECSEHACVPIPKQHVRYQIQTGPGEQGVVRLCAFCYCNAHMTRPEYRWRGQQKAGAR